ncbi:MAG: hypothetical protein R2848_17690 [Thermomicrobiales bacterium]
MGTFRPPGDAGDPVEYETLDSGVDQATEESRIEAYYLANPDIVGMFGTGATDSLSVGKVSQKYGLAAEWSHYRRVRPVAGDSVAHPKRRYDVHHRPAAVSAGIHSHAAALFYKLSGGAVAPANTDTSLAYVTIDNVDTYLAPSRFEGSTEDPPA